MPSPRKPGKLGHGEMAKSLIQYAHICDNNDSDELIRLGEQEGFGIDKESIDENQVWDRVRLFNTPRHTKTRNLPQVDYKVTSQVSVLDYVCHTTT